MPESLPEYIKRSCTLPADPELLSDLHDLLNDAFQGSLKKGEQMNVSALLGKSEAFLSVTIGNEVAGHVFEFFTKDVPGEGLEGALGFVIDFAQGALEEFFASKRESRFPLDFCIRVFEGQQIYARYTYRNFAAEKLANDFLS